MKNSQCNYVCIDECIDLTFMINDTILLSFLSLSFELSFLVVCVSKVEACVWMYDIFNKEANYLVLSRADL